MRRPITLLFTFSLLFSFGCKQKNSKISTTDKTQPNIIYILADDMGYGDVSYLNQNSKIQTSNIDNLAKQGISFSDAHSNSAVCTPTRYGILTGRYAWRTWMKNGVLWSYDKPLIDASRATVATLLKRKGYHTACIGKWHLGLDWPTDANGEIAFKNRINGTPNDNGFDEFYGITASLDIPPYFYIKNHHITATKIDSIDGTTGKGFWREGPIGNDFKHDDVLPHITNKAVSYIQEQANTEQPFFLYFPLPAPHTPILPSPKFKGKSAAGEYGDFVLMVDDVVGQITEALKKNGIEDNTLIIFTSDNGFAPAADLEEQLSLGHNPSHSYRGHKADIFEGGHRIPFIAKWPNQIKAGTNSDETVCLTDLIATVSTIIQEPISDNMGEDSYNILPLLLGKKVNSPIREATVHHSIEGIFSIRQDKWKLIFGPGSGGWSQPLPKEARKNKLPLLQLYNLENDVAEKNNVAVANPDIVNKLTKLMNTYIQNGRSTPGKVQKNEGETQFLPKPYSGE
ncbi:MAG: arylsulfatase [Cellulophaga sp.]